ncbi:HET-domain-containing protein [Lindgomyces ingoldianus]|uniref:HET-domain-containing protein n=1 Tax=Lindgomyces ingoldianus TaxID=673940 RepID=A0ACB6Q8Z6_9PLEO|nr:HET-domain-containing protein [Lindgomyces ingoldianus]KAF2462620.1 HET-domain-containing protein [Lindgomyces ingoldianus]
MAGIRLYDYRKLTPLDSGQIRLLKLHPGEVSSELRGQLIVNNIKSTNRGPMGYQTKSGNDTRAGASTIDYRALSYTWGTGHPSNHITILHDNEPYTIPIKPNLEDALIQLRSADVALFFWIDALCMDQNDNQEKSSQIPMMSEIYKQAASVCIWLGREEKKSDLALCFIKRCVNLDDIDHLCQDPKYAEEWDALLSLMRRPWFNRRWIVQELVRATTAIIYCGNKSQPWQEFADAVSLFSFKQDDIRKLFQRSEQYNHHPDYIGDLDELGAVKLVYAWDNVFRKSEDGLFHENLLSLEALVSFLTVFEASDPRDTLYAILWLAKDAKPVDRHATNWGERLKDIIREDQNSQREQFVWEKVESPLTLPRLGSDIDSRRRRASSGSMSEYDGQDDSQDGRSVLSGNLLHSDPDSLHISAAVNPLEAVVEQDENSYPTRVEAPPIRITQHLTEISGNTAGRNPKGSLSKDQARKAKGVLRRMVGSIEGQRVIVNYEKSVFDVCRDFLEFVILRSKSLDILCYPWAPEPDRNKNERPLPTWIPSLRNSAFAVGPNRAYRRVNADPLVGKPGLDMKVYNAHKDHPATGWSVLPENPRILVLRGVVLDTIGQRFTPAIEGVIPLDWLDAVGWTDPKVSPPDVFWRTLVGNRDAHGKRPPSHWKRACKDTFSRRPQSGDLNSKDLLSYNCPSAVYHFLKRMQCVTWKRKLVMFEKHRMPNHLGLAPAKVKKGDLVCILHGCSVPVILRKYVSESLPVKVDQSGWGSRNVEYEWVGECYVHGFMDGEAGRLPGNPQEDSATLSPLSNPGDSLTLSLGDSGKFYIR